MSFTISNITSSQGVASGKLERLRVAHKKLDNKSQTSNKTTPTMKASSSDTLRFELSTLNQKSVDIQNKISKGQSTQVALSNLSSQLEDLKENYDEISPKQLSESIDKTVQDHTFEGEQVLNQKDANTSSNSDLQAVTVDRPPKVGAYSISIFQDSNNNSDEVHYTVEVSSSNEDFNKTITTSLVPTTGLISGVEIYFDKEAIRNSESKSLQADVEVKDAQEFQISNFSNDLENLKNSSSKSDFDEKASQLMSKIDSNKALLDKDIKSTQIQYQNTQSVRENLSATSNESFDLSAAAQLVNQTQETLLNSPESTNNLYQTDSAKSLLE
ncbi:MAG: hypothetical protein KC646_16330 [Candidatus Cloacimonetes bacterium]|nr:hypothetical protein [Candidatus Cloacimonadota bacterium]